jgi:transposase
LDRDCKVGVRLDGSTGGGVPRLEEIEGPSVRRRRTKAERARIAAEIMMPRSTVADVARKHGTTRWQIYDWREQLRKGNLVLPESVAALPICIHKPFEIAEEGKPSGAMQIHQPFQKQAPE